MVDFMKNGHWTVLSKPFLSFGPLLTPEEIYLSYENGNQYYDRPQLSTLNVFAHYIADYLTAENAQLGRKGPVCPFIKGAIERDYLHMTCCSFDSSQEESLHSVMDRMRVEFISWRQPGKFDNDEIYRSVVVLFPYLDAVEHADLIENVQKSLKFSFVEQGLMIGEFYPTCMAPGLHNPDFRPFQAPVLSLAIRYMTVFDAPFMMGDERYIESFCQRFGDSGRKRVESLRRTLNAPGRKAGSGAYQPLDALQNSDAVHRHVEQPRKAAETR